jgi:hypothetical protein
MVQVRDWYREMDAHILLYEAWRDDQAAKGFPSPPFPARPVEPPMPACLKCLTGGESEPKTRLEKAARSADNDREAAKVELLAYLGQRAAGGEEESDQCSAFR